MNDIKEVEIGSLEHIKQMEADLVKLTEALDDPNFEANGIALVEQLIASTALSVIHRVDKIAALTSLIDCYVDLIAMDKGK